MTLKEFIRWAWCDVLPVHWRWGDPGKKKNANKELLARKKFPRRGSLFSCQFLALVKATRCSSKISLLLPLAFNTSPNWEHKHWWLVGSFQSKLCIDHENLVFDDNFKQRWYDNSHYLPASCGIDCSTTVVHTPRDREVVDSNPAGCWAFFSSLSFSVSFCIFQWCVLN